MHLTVFSDYTLRVLIYLGLKREALATIAEIADAYGISKNHLMKVVHHLAMQGYLETVRGKGGGIRLARAPGEISVGAVVRGTEAGSAIVECFEPSWPECCIAPACGLRGVLARALEAFFAVLDRYTLADLLANRAQLIPLLFPAAKRRTARR
jgi:Rrf2 family nitric oxide-sensitive transcriptional repressor